MNIIVFTKHRGSSRQFDLKKTPTLVTLIGGVTLVAGLLFASGFLLAANKLEVSPDERIVELQATIDSQSREIENTRLKAQENLEALAARIGRMQAHVIRLDALGRRLTQMADLDDGEFNFGDAPPSGGPELSVERGQVDSEDFIAGLNDLGMQLEDREQQLDVLESLLMNRNLQNQVHPAGRPVKSGWISSFYGGRRDPFTGRKARHEGVDFAGREGAPIVAVGAGVVTWSGDRFGYGNMVEVSHGNGYVTRYAHNKANTVSVGDKVEKGQVVALMGSTGRATGPNLHFEVRHKGHSVDPLKFIRAQAR